MPWAGMPNKHLPSYKHQLEPLNYFERMLYLWIYSPVISEYSNSVVSALGAYLPPRQGIYALVVIVSLT